MEDSTRARVAAIVGAAFKNKKVSSIYDYNMSGHKNISVVVAYHQHFHSQDNKEDKHETYNQFAIFYSNRHLTLSR